MELDFLCERYALSMEKIHCILEEGYGDEVIRPFFVEVAIFLQRLNAYYAFEQKDDKEQAFLEQLSNPIDSLNKEIFPENYGRSYANPVYAMDKLGSDFGRLLSALYAEIRSVITMLQERTLEEVLIRFELFLEVYSAFEHEWQEESRWPAYDSVQQILYWYVSDYSDITADLEVDRFLRVKEREGIEKPSVICGEGEFIPGLLQGIVTFGSNDSESPLMICCEAQSYRQYEEDHKADRALLWDKAMVKRRLEVLQTALDKYSGSLVFREKAWAEDCYRRAEMSERQNLRNC